MILKSTTLLFLLYFGCFTKCVSVRKIDADNFCQLDLYETSAPKSEHLIARLSQSDTKRFYQTLRSYVIISSPKGNCCWELLKGKTAKTARKVIAAEKGNNGRYEEFFLMQPYTVTCCNCSLPSVPLKSQLNVYNFTDIEQGQVLNSTLTSSALQLASNCWLILTLSSVIVLSKLTQ